MASNMPTTPPSNVTPLWGGGSPSWPSAAVPPGCFSELARLNQCYNEVQMMEMILSKVVCDLAQNNTAFQQCLVNAIAASGSNVPLIGVTNGADAQPGQVGEYVMLSAQFTIGTALGTQVLTLGTLQPGDWDITMYAAPSTYIDILAFTLVVPVPPGFNGGGGGAFFGAGTEQGVVVVGSPLRALTSAPSLIAVSIVSQAPTSQQASIYFTARRRR